jgi:hypothetical protein
MALYPLHHPLWLQRCWQKYSGDWSQAEPVVD